MLVTYNVKIPQNSMNSGTIFKWRSVTRTRQVVKHGVEFGVFFGVSFGVEFGVIIGVIFESILNSILPIYNNTK